MEFVLGEHGVRIVRELCQLVHGQKALQPAIAAELWGEVKLVQANATNLVFDVQLKSECSFEVEREIGKHHQLIVFIPMRLIKLGCQCWEVEFGGACKPLSLGTGEEEYLTKRSGPPTRVFGCCALRSNPRFHFGQKCLHTPAQKHRPQTRSPGRSSR